MAEQQPAYDSTTSPPPTSASTMTKKEETVSESSAETRPIDSKASIPGTEVIPDAPDPDEDDLDDLDDLLDQFAANSVSGSGPGRPAAKPAATAPIASTTKGIGQTNPHEPDVGADFSSQLQKEMAALLGEIDESPEMRQQLDTLMSEFTSNAGDVLKDGDEAPGNKDLPATDAAFTETIKRTMERMAASGEQASAAAASGGEEDMLAALLKDLASGGGDGSEEDFSKMLLGMMEQLTNKEVLYEPMKELDDKFPIWMKENEGKVPAEDMTRYKEQRDLVKEIVGRFERPGYTDENTQDREYIVERMQKMQAAGNPPPDLVGNMEDTHNALGNIGNDCAQQ